MMRSAAARGEVAVLDRARKGSRAFIARCCSIFSRICVGSKIWEVEVVDLMKFTMPFQPSGCCLTNTEGGTITRQQGKKSDLIR